MDIRLSTTLVVGTGNAKEADPAFKKNYDQGPDPEAQNAAFRLKTLWYRMCQEHLKKLPVPSIFYQT